MLEYLAEQRTFPANAIPAGAARQTNKNIAGFPRRILPQGICSNTRFRPRHRRVQILGLKTQPSSSDAVSTTQKIQLLLSQHRHFP